jgi:predicted esterase
MKGVCMKAIRTLWMTSLVFAVQTCVGGQPALKTGVQTLPGTLPNTQEKGASLTGDFDLSKETFYISVPSGNSASQPHGILVFMSPADECADVPPGWAGVLKEKKLIFIAPQKAGNKQDTSRRAGLAVLAATKLLEMAEIDTNRVYVAGFSGGARIASYSSFLRPSLFSGVFSVCGVDFPRKVPRVKATKDDEYGYFSLGEEEVAEARKRVKFVLVTGSKDFRYGNIMDIYAGGFQKDGYTVKLIDVPGMDHAICSPKALRDGISFLDKKTGTVPDGK